MYEGNNPQERENTNLSTAGPFSFRRGAAIEKRGRRNGPLSLYREFPEQLSAKSLRAGARLLAVNVLPYSQYSKAPRWCQHCEVMAVMARSTVGDAVRRGSSPDGRHVDQSVNTVAKPSVCFLAHSAGITDCRDLPVCLFHMCAPSRHVWSSSGPFYNGTMDGTRVFLSPHGCAHCGSQASRMSFAILGPC
ncbi:hypothetical protein BU23DRAFT_54014 [Bimuria novae-zelandiae CBS 107.79]|uniref:Uncharacterized protein n=1 Tax=Bimuria novae-zelandiae CBS 107.79 TaxID=1447943 RepID=A0A6A5UU90_9PLEO|nr:hypothetical protein BU23DRAFT_54014 [Bimuria novae-zelandiae CBS 107.79]